MKVFQVFRGKSFTIFVLSEVALFVCWMVYVHCTYGCGHIQGNVVIRIFSSATFDEEIECGLLYEGVE